MTIVETGRLVFKSYKPLRLEKGMFFLVKQGNEMVIAQLGQVPFNEDEYIQQNGYPVEPYVIMEGNPNLNDGYVLLQPHEIGWWDEGEESDELYDITPKEINNILDMNALVDVEVYEEDDNAGRSVAVIYEGKGILSYTEFEEDDDDDDDNYMFEGDEPWDNQNLNENETN